MNCLTVKDIAHALELIVLHESDVIYAHDLLSEDDTQSSHFIDGSSLSTESLPYVFWEFFHGVFLNFAVEELSQVSTIKSVI